MTKKEFDKWQDEWNKKAKKINSRKNISFKTTLGNPEENIAIFNHMNSDIDMGGDVSSADGGSSVGMGESYIRKIHIKK